MLHNICAAQQEVEGHMYIKVYILAAKTIETGDICTLDANFYGGNNLEEEQKHFFSHARFSLGFLLT